MKKLLSLLTIAALILSCQGPEGAEGSSGNTPSVNYPWVVRSGELSALKAALIECPVVYLVSKVEVKEDETLEIPASSRLFVRAWSEDEPARAAAETYTGELVVNGPLTLKKGTMLAVAKESKISGTGEINIEGDGVTDATLVVSDASQLSGFKFSGLGNIKIGDYTQGEESLANIGSVAGSVSIQSGDELPAAPLAKNETFVWTGLTHDVKEEQILIAGEGKLIIQGTSVTKTPLQASHIEGCSVVFNVLETSSTVCDFSSADILFSELVITGNTPVVLPQKTLDIKKITVASGKKLTLSGFSNPLNIEAFSGDIVLAGTIEDDVAISGTGRVYINSGITVNAKLSIDADAYIEPAASAAEDITVTIDDVFGALVVKNLTVQSGGTKSAALDAEAGSTLDIKNRLTIGKLGKFYLEYSPARQVKIKLPKDTSIVVESGGEYYDRKPGGGSAWGEGRVNEGKLTYNYGSHAFLSIAAADAIVDDIPYIGKDTDSDMTPSAPAIRLQDKTSITLLSTSAFLEGQQNVYQVIGIYDDFSFGTESASVVHDISLLYINSVRVKLAAGKRISLYSGSQIKGTGRLEGADNTSKIYFTGPFSASSSPVELTGTPELAGARSGTFYWNTDTEKWVVEP